MWDFIPFETRSNTNLMLMCRILKYFFICKAFNVVGMKRTVLSFLWLYSKNIMAFSPLIIL